MMKLSDASSVIRAHIFQGRSEKGKAIHVDTQNNIANARANAVSLFSVNVI